MCDVRNCVLTHPSTPSFCKISDMALLLLCTDFNLQEVQGTYSEHQHREMLKSAKQITLEAYVFQDTMLTFHHSNPAQEHKLLKLNDCTCRLGL